MQNCQICKKEVKKGDYEVEWGKLNRREECGFVASIMAVFYLCKKDFKAFKKRNGMKHE